MTKIRRYTLKAGINQVPITSECEVISVGYSIDFCLWALVPEDYEPSAETRTFFALRNGEALPERREMLNFHGTAEHDGAVLHVFSPEPVRPTGVHPFRVR